jgi:hypothetical protein
LEDRVLEAKEEGYSIIFEEIEEIEETVEKVEYDCYEQEEEQTCASKS